MSEIIVTIVHDDRDCIKYQLKILRDGLKHVTPSVNFKSCCVWEFTDNIFDENRAVLVILTKQCKPFRRKVLESFQRYRDRCRKVECRVCVVFEVEGCAIKESAIDRDNATKEEANRRSTDFESVIGNKSFAMIKAGECSNEKNRTVPKAEGGNIEENAESVTDKENVAVVHAHRGSTEETLKGVAEKASVIIVQAYNEMINEDLECVTDKNDVAHNNDADDEIVIEDLGSVRDNQKASIDEADSETILENSKSETSKENAAVVKSEGSNIEEKFKCVSRKGCNVLIEASSEPTEVNLESVKGKKIIGVIEGDGEAIKYDFESLTDKETVAVIAEGDETIKRNFESVTGKENIIFVEPYDETIQEDSKEQTAKDNFAVVDTDQGNKAEDFETKRGKQISAEIKADGDDIKGHFECLIGKENVVVLEDLYQSVKWLPKVCAFLFKTNRQNKSLKCVIPDVRDISEVSEFRKDFMNGLLELDIAVSESFYVFPSRCCILFKDVDDEYDLAPDVKFIFSKKTIMKRVGGTIFEYKMSYDDEPEMQPSNEIIYGKDSLVIFIIHLLYVMEIINITTLLGKRLWRIKKSNETAVNCDCCNSIKCCDCCDFIKSCHSLQKDCCNLQCDSDDLSNCVFNFCAFVGLLLVVATNPSVILFFLTPFPYLLYVCCEDGFVRKVLIKWVVLCTAGIYGGFMYLFLTQVEVGFELTGILPVFCLLGLIGSAAIQISFIKKET